MKKKLVIFDLDGVLIDFKDFHFEALNRALAEVDPKFVISKEDHIKRFDGKPTATKLLMLNLERALPIEKINEINERKQELTQNLIYEHVNESEELKFLFSSIRKTGCWVAVASNSKVSTVYAALQKLGLLEYVDSFFGNTDVDRAKPHPDIYWHVMQSFDVEPAETVIVEDSPVGLAAAYASGANVIRVSNSNEVRGFYIHALLGCHINDILGPKLKSKSTKWSAPELTVLIPMAGAGSRFASAGYADPKPLVSVFGKPMIQQVINSLGLRDTKYVFIAQEEHVQKYNLKHLLRAFVPDDSNCDIAVINGMTEGAACTALLAKGCLKPNDPLLIVNSDQYIEWDAVQTMYELQESGVDGAILTFEANDPKWSYVKTDESGNVTEVAEKRVISNQATVGVYFWKRASDFIKYAEQMIQKNIRTNNEFYICPVFNEAIQDGKKIVAKPVDAMWGMGTPEDLRHFLTMKAGTQ